MNLQNKRAFITFELLLVIIISSFVLINSFTSIKDLYTITKTQQNIAISKIDLLTTKIFLKKNLKDLDKLIVKKKVLYFKDSILLENIESFNKKDANGYIQIELKTTNNKKHIWILKP